MRCRAWIRRLCLEATVAMRSYPSGLVAEGLPVTLSGLDGKGWTPWTYRESTGIAAGLVRSRKIMAAFKPVARLHAQRYSLGETGGK